MTYKMIVKTETPGRRAGATKTETEQIRFIPEAEVESYREVARTTAPLGSTRTIRVVQER